MADVSDPVALAGRIVGIQVRVDHVCWCRAMMTVTRLTFELFDSPGPIFMLFLGHILAFH